MAVPRPAATFGRNNSRDSVVLPDDPFLGVQRGQTTNPEGLSREHLREQARWIRDTLDIEVARDGPDALHSDDLLTMDELIRKLLECESSREDIRYSRMHLAIKTVSGLATRWPKKMIERCDVLQNAWSTKFGDLQGTLLYEPGGRLHGICKPEDLDKEMLIVKWLKSTGSRLSPIASRKTGGLGFVPGDWWISPLFAHCAGIIDSNSSEGGIVCDAHAAYAVIMTGSDEKAAPDSETIQYRARSNDPGRYRLTAASPQSRQPVRILRSHRLNSPWKPRAGLRYDGLYKITGWSLKRDSRTRETEYIVNFQRLPNQVSFETVLARPWVDELEDYTEYKRLRDVEHAKQKEKEDRQPKSPDSVPAIDGMADANISENIQTIRTKDDPLWHAKLVSRPKEQPVRPENPSIHDMGRKKHDSNSSTAVPIQFVPGMQAEWWKETLRTPQDVQTVPEHRKTPSEADITVQKRRADADQR